MNIIEAEDLVKGLPDQALFQEAQFPSGRIPQFLAVSEVQRRQDMRQRFQAAQQGQQATVKDQILQGGIGSTGMAPEMSSAPPMAPQMPPQGAPMPPQMPPPMGMAGGGITPGGIAYMQVGGVAPGADTGAVMFSNMMGRLPEAFKTIRGLMPNVGGVSAESLQRLRPTREQYFDPQQETRRTELLAQLNAMGDTRRAEDIAAAERYLKEAESPIQAAQDEARKAAIASTLMRLGAGVAAGKPAEGLASATEAVEQTLGRAREVASAERRAARQDYRASEREAIRGQRSVADQAFMMQAQNITNDENKQREFVRDQNQFAQWAFTQQREAGRDQAAAFNDALRLSIGISQSIEQAVKDAARERGLDERQFSSTYGSIFKEVVKEMKDADYGNDEDGNPIVPTPEQLLSSAREQTIKSLEAAGIYSPSSVVNVTTPNELNSLSKGQRYRGPDGVVRIKP
jgi:hypothetical protein